MAFLAYKKDISNFNLIKRLEQCYVKACLTCARCTS